MEEGCEKCKILLSVGAGGARRMSSITWNVTRQASHASSIEETSHAMEGTTQSPQALWISLSVVHIDSLSSGILFQLRSEDFLERKHSRAFPNFVRVIVEPREFR
ncbi:hypothetical protein K7X08_008572 [Anisodus acutangulus]|uniref:Uncharacterized protein n=1 Tax=Anisodus acutangulus TaxID=402998 RepID=A0A9Q1MUR9_9SOLA|nr:hypothetical protein K7X08_008572 [Anisodus acutangulus]